jgi:hypothetical protein
MKGRAMGDREVESYDDTQRKLDHVLSTLEMMSAQLFGSEKDHYAAGRLPIIEAKISGIDNRLGAVELVQAREAGASKVLFPFLRWSGALFIGVLCAGLGAFFHWLYEK